MIIEEMVRKRCEEALKAVGLPIPRPMDPEYVGPCIWMVEPRPSIDRDTWWKA